MRHDRMALLAALLMGIGAAVAAADPPVLKAGMWEVVRTTTQQPDQKHTTTMCLDESVQAEMRELGMGIAKEMCSDHERHFEGGKLMSSATCKMGNTTVKARTTMTFSGNTAYHSETNAIYDPPLMNVKESKSVIEGKWAGLCKAGQQPGDITLETGQTINMKAMTKK